MSAHFSTFFADSLIPGRAAARLIESVWYMGLNSKPEKKRRQTPSQSFTNPPRQPFLLKRVRSSLVGTRTDSSRAQSAGDNIRHLPRLSRRSCIAQEGIPDNRSFSAIMSDRISITHDGRDITLHTSREAILERRCGVSLVFVTHQQ